MTSSIEAFVRLLSEPVSRPAPVRVGLTRRRGRVRGLTVRQVRDLADRHPDARRTVWRLFRLMPGKIEGVSKADVAALFDAVQTSLGCRSIVTALRLTRLPSDVFDQVVRDVVDMTTPDPERVDDLFRPRDEAPDADRAPRPQGVWSDPAVALADVVEAMTARGFSDPASWTPGRLLYQASKAAQREADLERVRMLNATYAHRLSKTKETTFKSEVSKLAKDL